MESLEDSSLRRHQRALKAVRLPQVGLYSRSRPHTEHLQMGLHLSCLSELGWGRFERSERKTRGPKQRKLDRKFPSTAEASSGKRIARPPTSTQPFTKCKDCVSVSIFPRYFHFIPHLDLAIFSIQKVTFIQVVPYGKNCHKCVKKIRQ